ncbi:phage head morphogenesis protein [Gracilibacillus caseinilyticus]|uniref:Phage head morphogenesis protein n=1 Tax=Gracilibacillus caseinilyticus TaxID=2932256 RepID=A0ABY4EV93_9BACI|nr:minor capsid protein [Gracilibacillus caseinilyticus]UOQ47747.1 phage head morphogenesis protein [Gracilibacillus caseinilyticus]
MNDFEKQLLEMIDSIYTLSDKEYKEVLKMYRDSRNNIKQFIANLYMEYGNNGKLDINQLRNNGSIDQLQTVIEEEAEQIAQNEVNLTPIILATVFATTYYKSAYQMESSFEVGIDFKLLKKEFIDNAVNYDWSGIPFSERIWENRNGLVRNLRTEITRGFIDGDGIDKMGRRLNKQFNSKAYQAQRLLRTETARVIDQAQQEIYQDSGVVKYVQWVATLEENTCEECANLDGERFKLDNPSKPTIPRHPNCRCTWIGVPYEEYNPERRKNNENKQIETYKTFDEWAEQNNIPI